MPYLRLTGQLLSVFWEYIFQKDDRVRVKPVSILNIHDVTGLFFFSFQLYIYKLFTHSSLFDIWYLFISMYIFSGLIIWLYSILLCIFIPHKWPPCIEILWLSNVHCLIKWITHSTRQIQRVNILEDCFSSAKDSHNLRPRASFKATLVYTIDQHYRDFSRQHCMMITISIPPLRLIVSCKCTYLCPKGIIYCAEYCLLNNQCEPWGRGQRLGTSFALRRSESIEVGRKWLPFFSDNILKYSSQNEDLHVWIKSKDISFLMVLLTTGPLE